MAEAASERSQRIFNEGKRDGEHGRYDEPHAWFWNSAAGSDYDAGCQGGFWQRLGLDGTGTRGNADFYTEGRRGAKEDHEGDR